MADRFDAIVLVEAPEAVQLARLQSRGLDEAEARRRLATQWPAARKAARADFVIDTGTDLATTEVQVARIHAALLADPRASTSGADPSIRPPDGKNPGFRAS